MKEFIGLADSPSQPSLLPAEALLPGEATKVAPFLAPMNTSSVCFLCTWSGGLRARRLRVNTNLSRLDPVALK